MLAPTMVRISQPGMGALVIRAGEGTLFVDAFTRFSQDAEVAGRDLLLFTHADHDHFDPAQAAARLAGNGVQVIGPPSIGLPLIRRGIAVDRIHVSYPFHVTKPESLTVGALKAKVFNTRHFNDWNPDHVSYLLEWGGKRIYVTGDSYDLPEDPDLHGCDLVVSNLVGKPRDRPESVTEYLEQLEEVRARLGAKWVLPNHLIACEWAVRPGDMKAAVEARQLATVPVLLDPDDTLSL